jgi:hypothetical protein
MLSASRSVRGEQPRKEGFDRALGRSSRGAGRGSSFADLVVGLGELGGGLVELLAEQMDLSLRALESGPQGVHHAVELVCSFRRGLGGRLGSK